MTNLTEVARAYRSTNITTAEEGLLKYRRWLLDRLEIDKTNSAGYNPSLYRTDARLFQLYEFKGETNQGDFFYREAAEVSSRMARAKHFSEYRISKEELREQLVRQEKGEDIGWKSSNKSAAPPPSP